MKDEDRGRVKHVWPDGPEAPGLGRGVLAGDCVLWTTHENLYFFDQQTAQPRRVVDLAVRGASGGNLLVTDGRLLIATDAELIAIGPYGGKSRDGEGIANCRFMTAPAISQFATCNFQFAIRILTDTPSCPNTTTSKPYTN